MLLVFCRVNISRTFLLFFFLFSLPYEKYCRQKCISRPKKSELLPIILKRTNCFERSEKSVILPDIFNGVTYVKLLRNNLPDILEDIPLREKQNNFSARRRQAHTHNARIVTAYLNEQFPRRWMQPIRKISRPLQSSEFLFLRLL